MSLMLYTDLLTLLKHETKQNKAITIEYNDPTRSSAFTVAGTGKKPDCKCTRFYILNHLIRADLNRIKYEMKHSGYRSNYIWY